jgi:trigger factor
VGVRVSPFAPTTPRANDDVHRKGLSDPMEVTVEKSSELRRTLKVKVPSEQLQQKIDTRLKELAKQVKLKGFRPGKIPHKVMLQRYGKSVQQEVVSALVQSSLSEAIERESLRPASNPVLENLPELKAGSDFEFTASIEVYPEFGSIDPAMIILNRPESGVTEADIDEMLQTLRDQRKTWKEIEGKASKGDQVALEYVAETPEGPVPADGRQRISIIIGASGFKDLEKAVSTLTAGDSKKAKLTFPDEYGDPQLAGKKLSVELEVKLVQQAEVPEIDEEFIRSFAVESGKMDDLRSEVRGNLERELDQATKSYLKTQLVGNLLDSYANTDVPQSIVDQEANNLRNRAAQAQKVEPDTMQLEPFMDSAIKRVRSGLLLADLARQNHIMIDGARVRAAIETVAETYEQPLEVVQMYYSNKQLLDSVENIVLEEQVVDWVVENAKVSDVKMSFKEVISAAAAAGQEL